MNTNQTNGRRQNDQRSDADRRTSSRQDADRRQDERRLAQRRKFIRVTFPVSDTPKILKADPESLATFCRPLSIISNNSISFICIKSCPICEYPVEIGQSINLSLLFHDETTLNITGKVTKTYHQTRSNLGTVVCTLDDGIPDSYIDAEKTYLISNHPEFYRLNSCVTDESLYTA